MCLDHHLFDGGIQFLVVQRYKYLFLEISFVFLHWNGPCKKSPTNFTIFSTLDSYNLVKGHQIEYRIVESRKPTLPGKASYRGLPPFVGNSEKQEVANIAGPMTHGQKRKYVEDASTSQEKLPPSTIPNAHSLCRLLLSPLHPLRHRRSRPPSRRFPQHLHSHPLLPRLPWLGRNLQKNVFGTRPCPYQRSRMLGKIGQERFYKVKRKVEEEVVVPSTAVSDDLALITIVAGGVRHGHVYGAGSEAVHLRAKSSRTLSCRGLAPLGLCCPLYNSDKKTPYIEVKNTRKPSEFGTKYKKIEFVLDSTASCQHSLPPTIGRGLPSMVGLCLPIPFVPQNLLAMVGQPTSRGRIVGNKHTDANLSIEKLCQYSLPTNITTSMKLFNYANISENFVGMSVKNGVADGKSIRN
ncbi:hypothetical protein M9H77_18696 [Catharanthus roseus]|uniref:Uncharacterized protein n=1 Tax=Catharanthus roseus TaxID=4058 RepID=A0ACC0B8H2_CATRO|nr:hypothetical protein M9H77_18696 [Catharanthus roseus]